MKYIRDGFIDDYMEQEMGAEPKSLMAAAQANTPATQQANIPAAQANTPAPQTSGSSFFQDLYDLKFPAQARQRQAKEAASAQQQQLQQILNSDSFTNADPITKAKMMMISGNSNLQSAGANILEKYNMPKDLGDVSTFEIGAGNGKKQRARFDRDGNLLPLGEAYASHAPRQLTDFEIKMQALGNPDKANLAREAMRNPFLKTDTDYVNTVDPSKNVSRNLVGAGVQKGYAKNLSEKLEGYSGYQKSSQAAEADVNRMIEDLTSLDSMTNNWTTGAGSFLKSIPVTDANVWNEKKETIMSGIALNKMLELKEASSTGATGFGALSQKELDVLQKNISSLEQSQNPKEIKKSINRIVRHMKRIKYNVTKDRRAMGRWYKSNKSKYNADRGGAYHSGKPSTQRIAQEASSTRPPPPEGYR